MTKLRAFKLKISLDFKDPDHLNLYPSSLYTHAPPTHKTTHTSSQLYMVLAVLLISVTEYQTEST